MEYQLASNEFTSNELLQFFDTAYGTQINGTPFSHNTLQNWRRRESVPIAYGGYKITSTMRHWRLGNLLVFTIDGLSREEAEAMIGTFDGDLSTDIVTSETKHRNLRPRKQRTKLYYQILKAAGKQYTKKTLEQATLPVYWKEAGIKRNQMINKRRSKLQK